MNPLAVFHLQEPGPRKRIITFLLFVFAASLTSAAGAGTVTGRVMNASSGEYLEKARVSIEGTDRQTLTDNLGHYTLTNVPAGSVQLRAFYTGLEVESSTVVVTESGTVQLDFVLKRFGTAPSGDSGTIKLSKFVVSESAEMDPTAIAINEKRFSPNIKNVIAANEFGPVVDGNLGEVLKFVPGVDIIYSGGFAVGASLNGVGSDYTPMTVNGFGTASSQGTTQRSTEFMTLSTNNLSRVEVLHSPTPESPGMALAGSINMVTKSAFERTKPSFNWNAFLSMRDNTRDFHKTPGPGRDMTRKVDPGVDFSLLVPVNKRFGFTLSGSRSTDSISSDNIALTWSGASADTNGGTLPDTPASRPYLTTVEVVDFPRRTTRSSVGATLDFKLTERDRISLSMQSIFFRGLFSGHRQTFFVNRVEPGNFSPTFTHGFRGAGEVRLTNSPARDRTSITHSPTLTYRHDGRIWKAEAGIGLSHSTDHGRDVDKGFFTVAVVRRTGVTIDFDDNFYLRPGRITVRDGTTGQVIDPNDINNYSIADVSGRFNDTLDLKRSAYGNLARTVHWRIPIKLKGGFEVAQQVRDLRDITTNYRYGGPDGRPSTTPVGNDDGAGPIIDDLFSQRPAPYGFGSVQWPSNDKLWELYRANPTRFVADANAAYRNQINLSKRAEETISALYLRTDFSLLDGRLNFVGGVRAEQTNIEGEGPLTDATRNFRRDASGKVILDSAGRTIPITTDPLETARLTLIDRGTQVDKEYLRYFPNGNLAYNIRDNLIARVAYYHSVGRPNFNQYVGGLTLPNTEMLPGTGNRITVNNAGIKAWSARTTKLSLEYYFERVGLISASAFRRDFENFFGTTVFVPSSDFLGIYGLDPAVFGGYEVSTQYNIQGPVRMEGLNFNYKQNLTWLPHWARGVQVFANASTLRATGDVSAQQNFAGFVPRIYSGGFSLTREKFDFRINGNYRGMARRAKVNAGRSVDNRTFIWDSKRMYIDISGSYRLRKDMSLFVSLRNVGNATQDIQIFGPDTPEVAQFRQREDFGAVWVIGMKGGF
jgi:iron complex outermembrane receptor protein